MKATRHVVHVPGAALSWMRLGIRLLGWACVALYQIHDGEIANRIFVAEPSLHLLDIPRCRSDPVLPEVRLTDGLSEMAGVAGSAIMVRAKTVTQTVTQLD